MSYTASFQSLCKCGVGILRVHPAGGDWEHRDGYIWCCTMRIVDKTMELWGTEDAPPLSHARAIRKYAVENNFDFVAYERHGEWVVWDVKSRTVTRK